jgi:hypothetical protein
MSACASFNHVEERTAAVRRLFEPEEVATVIDLFAPIQQARIRAAYSVRAVDWPGVTAAVALLTGLCVVGVALVSARPQPQPPPARLARAPAPPPAVIATAPAIEAIEVPPPPEPPEPPRIVAMVVEPRPPSPTAVLASLNQRALAAYRRGDPAAAMTALERGVRLCLRPALAWHDLCARTHLHAGVVLAGGHGQHGLAEKHFRIARAIRPAITLPTNLHSRAIAAAFHDARR